MNDIANSAITPIDWDDELIACNPHMLVTAKATMGQSLKRGALLGRVSATGALVPCVPDATDGSESPVGVLAQDASAGTEATIYSRGDFNLDQLTVDPGHSIAELKYVLQAKGIRLHKRA